MSNDTNKTISIRIAIDIPVGVAAETLAQIEPLVSQLSSSQSQKPLSAPPTLEQSDEEIEEERRKAERDAEYAERLREFHSRKVQAYRTFRRIQGDCEKPYDAYRIIASQIGWSPSLIPRVISDRRKEINRYINERRKRIAVAMAFKGKTHKQIAKRLGVHRHTVGKLLKEARASLVGGANV